MEVIANKNETLGFGTSIGDQKENVRLEHATAGVLSSSVNVIPIFNDNSTEQSVSVAIAPTFSAVDSYLHLATEEEGPYYGINDYGIQQPGPDPMLLTDDPMSSATEINPQWSRKQGYNSNSIYPTSDGIVIDHGYYKNANLFGKPNTTAVGLVTKEYFTPASFTAEVQIKFTGVVGTLSEVDRPFYFAITDGYYLHDVGFHETFKTDGRKGFSIAGIGLHGYNDDPVTKDAFGLKFSYMDGRFQDMPYAGFEDDTERSWWYDRRGQAYQGSTKGPNFSEREDILNQGQPMDDLTSLAEWHTWRLAYDHEKHELSTYYDKVFLGSAIFKSGVFGAGTKLFIGGSIQGGIKTTIRNFKIYPNKVYRQRIVSLPENGGVFSASVSGVAFNLDRLTDQDSSTLYVAPDPDELTTVRVDFDKSYDIVNYSLQQRQAGGFDEPHPTIFGKNYDVKTADSATVNYGGAYSYINFYPKASNSDFSPVRPTDKRSPTWNSGLSESPTISGISYIEWNFSDYSTGWQEYSDFALYIRELYVYAEEWIDVASGTEDPNDNEVPWSQGRWKNLKQIGSKGALVLSDPRYSEVAYWPTPEYLFKNASYGSSSAELWGQVFQGTYYNPLTESLFSSPSPTHDADEQVRWTSAAQTTGDPFFLWRQFTEEVSLSVISVRTYDFVNKTVPTEFKYQYLKELADPNLEDSWADIPPVTQEYVRQTQDDPDAALRYNEYKKYKITNNDGEYYTNNHLQQVASPSDPGGTGSFQLGGQFFSVLTDVVPLEYRELDRVNNLTISNFRGALIVDLDTPIVTRGVRVVIKNPVVVVDTYAESTRLTVYEFQAWGTSGNGSYTSPVFDTGTSQNTERIVVETINTTTTHTNTYVRSSNIPPKQTYDLGFENWSPLGSLGQPGFSVSTTDTRGMVVSVGDESHFIIDEHFVYNHKTDVWSQPYGTYPAQPIDGPTASDTFDSTDLGSGSIAQLSPDPTVDGRAAIIDNVIYVACEETNLTASDRLMYLDLNEVSPMWSSLPEQRPLDTTNSTMCPYEKRLYFFNKDGPVYFWDTEESAWFFVEDVLPTLGGDRDRVSSVMVGGKIYLFGANNTSDGATSHEVSIFDPVLGTFTSGTPSIMAMRIVQPIVSEDGTIYVLPKVNTRDAHQRYYPAEDRWEVVTSLSWDRGYRAGLTPAYFYFHYDGYIYKVFGGFGGFSRTLVRKNPWQHAKYPDLRDVSWGELATSKSTPWRRVSNLGELMPQERYFQFKVELHSEDWVESPVLNSVRIVTPQTISIPASGTSSVYLKVSATEKETYRLWYAAKRRVSVYDDGYTAPGIGSHFDDDWNILYTESDVPSYWPQPVTASGFYVTHTSVGQPVSADAPRSPCVLEDGVGGYDIWFGLPNITATEGTFSTGPRINYINTDSPKNMSSTSTAQEISFLPALASLEGVWEPSVASASGSDYKMWATVTSYTKPQTKLILGEIQRIVYAESTDKINWTNQQVVISEGEDLVFGHDALSVYRPTVIYENSIYRMWYTCRDVSNIDRILYRESTDGINWGAISLSVDVGFHGTHDSRGASRPHIIRSSDNYYMFYFGYDGDSYVILRAQSPDGLDWVDPVVVMSGFGIEGRLDSEGVDDFFVLLTKDVVTPGVSLTTGKLKIHNEGSGL